MAQLNETLNLVKAARDDMRTALIAQGQNVTKNISTYADAIANISGGGTDTSDATAVAGDIASGKTAYVGGSKLTGTLTEVANPTSIITSGSSLYYKGVFFKPDEEADPDKPDGDASGSYVITGNTGTHSGDKYLVNWVKVSNTDDWYIKSQSKVKVGMPAATVANAIGLTSNKLKQGETMLNVQGSVVELNGETKTVTPTTSSQTIVPTGTGKNALTQVTVNAVTSAIDNNITAGNIKKDVSILGVTGTYEGSSSGGIKQFSSIQEMNSSTGNQDGDQALVYGMQTAAWTEDTRASILRFPATVVLDSAYTGDTIYSSFSAVDSGNTFYGDVMLTSSSFEFSMYTGSSSSVSYTSSDGITYTKVEGEASYDIGFDVFCQYEWNDILSNFIQGSVATFGGYFEYKVNYKQGDRIVFPNLADATISGTSVTINSTKPDAYKIEDLKALAVKIRNDFGITAQGCPFFYINKSNELCALVASTSDSYTGFNTLYNSSTGKFVGIGCINQTLNGTFKTYKITSVTNKTYTYIDQYTGAIHYGSGSSARYYLPIPDVDSVGFIYSNSASGAYDRMIIQHVGFYGTSSVTGMSGDYHSVVTKYLPVKSQLNLSSPSELFGGVTAYGEEGVITGDGSIYNNLDNSKILEGTLGLSCVDKVSSYAGDSYKLFGGVPTKFVAPETIDILKFYNEGSLSNYGNLALAKLDIDSGCPSETLEGYSVYNYRYYADTGIVVTLYKADNETVDNKYTIRVENVKTHTVLNTKEVTLAGTFRGDDWFHIFATGCYFTTYNVNSGMTVQKYDLSTFELTTVDTLTLVGIKYTGFQVKATDNYLVYQGVSTNSSNRKIITKILNTTTGEITSLRNDSIGGSGSDSNYSTMNVINQPDHIYVISKAGISFNNKYGIIKFVKSTKAVSISATSDSDITIGSYDSAVKNIYEDSSYIYFGGRLSKSNASDNKTYTKCTIRNSSGTLIPEYNNITSFGSIYYINNKKYVLAGSLFAEVDSFSASTDGIYVVIAFNCTKFYPVSSSLLVAIPSAIETGNFKVEKPSIIPATFTIDSENKYSFKASTIDLDANISFIPVVEGTSSNYTYGCLRGSTNSRPSDNDSFVFLNPEKGSSFVDYEEIGTISPAEATTVETNLSDILGEGE